MKFLSLVAFTVLSMTASAHASTPVFKCASKGSGPEDSFRINVFTSTDGSLKATLLGGQTTANTWVTYSIVEGTCNGGAGQCYQGESKKKIEGAALQFNLQVTSRMSKNENRSGFAATVTADTFDLRRPVGVQRLTLSNVSIVCERF